MKPDDKKAELNSSRQRGLSRLLLLARRNFVSIVHEELRKTGAPDLPDSCLTILPHIDLDGTSASVIAQRASLSKQAVVPLIASMEACGFVHKKSNPADGRSILISFTPEGIDYLHKVHFHISEIERQLGDALGQDEFDTLRNALVKIIAFRA